MADKISKETLVVGMALLRFKTNEESSDFHESRELVSETAELFLRMASLLPEGESIGWQFDAKSGACIVIGTSNSGLKDADIRMVFGKIAEVIPGPNTIKPTLAGKCRKIFHLIPEGDGRKDAVIPARESCLLGSRFGLIASDRYWEALRLLAERSAIIRFMAGRDGGRIYVSVPGKMGLDLQVMLSLLFPNLKAVGVLEEYGSVNGKPFVSAMSSILFSRFYDGSKGTAPDDRFDEELDLDFEDDIEREMEAPDFRAMLKDLIGLEDIKEQIRKIEAFARLKKEVKEKGEVDIPIALNMEFTGNPGTAKTTVARILAGILAEVGLIRDFNVYEVGRSDLVGRYVGETACKVKEVFHRAEGRVLFIDEAYSLVDDRDGSYGDEAINTIVQEMENNRDRTVVIFAGYPDKMKDFFATNPGLRSRVPFSLNFPDYSVDEMEQIVVREAEKRGFSVDEAAMETVRAACISASGDTESGNGRFARNLVENAILEYASRIYGEKESSSERVLKAEDLSYVYRPNKRTNRIGF